MEIYHEQWKARRIDNYKNGKQEGEWKFYHENGKLKELKIIKMERVEDNYSQWKARRRLFIKMER